MAGSVGVSPAARLMVVVALLVGVTLAFFTLYDRYLPVGPELLVDPGFDEGLSQWEVSGRGHAEIQGEEVVLKVKEKGSGVVIRQYLRNPGRYRILRLTAQLRAAKISPGTRPWHRGRLVLASFNEDQRFIPGPHVVADIKGTHAWQSYSGWFQIPADARDIRVGVELIGGTGVLAVRNLSVREGWEREFFQVFHGIGIVRWSTVIGWAGWVYIGNLRNRLSHLLVALLGIGIFIGALLPGGQMKMQLPVQSLTTEPAETIASAGQTRGVLSAGLQFVARAEISHFMAFALLAFTLSWAHVGESKWLLFSGVVLSASVTEVLQFFVDSRMPGIEDFALDFMGLMTGMMLFALVRRFTSSAALEHRSLF